MIVKLIPPQAREAILAVMPAFTDAEHFAPVNPKFLADSWEKIMSLAGGRAYGIQLDGKWRGFLLGSIVPDWVSGVLQGLEYFLLVEPEYRGTGAADALMNAFEVDCKDAGARWIVVGLSVLSEPEKRRRTWKRMGFSPHCETWLKRL